jgi:branched-chain amino acid transport system permease protein
LFAFEEIKKSFLVSIWFMFLTFPIMVIKVNTVENIVEWRWERMFMIGIGSFFLSFIWRYMLKRKESGQHAETQGERPERSRNR